MQTEGTAQEVIVVCYLLLVHNSAIALPGQLVLSSCAPVSLASRLPQDMLKSH